MTENLGPAAEWQYPLGERPLALFEGAPGLDPRPLLGQEVEIDRRRYLVKGVETKMIHNPAGLPFGLRVMDLP
jgi:hypothetical protein